MSNETKVIPREEKTVAESRGPAAAGLIAVGLLQLVLPTDVSFGPDWLLLVILAFFMIPMGLTHNRGLDAWNRWLGYVVLSLIGIALLSSLVMLITHLPQHTGAELLRSAGAIWLSNILVFASLYWRLDAGGPYQRDARREHFEHAAFLFPQMTMPGGPRGWKPNFYDYLFLAFNTSTAFSPTDVPVLGRWAKLAMMAQSLISLGTLALVAARAVNVIGS
jgi:hypothetical protein